MCEMRADKVILGSILSEKSVSLSEGKTYTLKVACTATKEDIRKAMKLAFDVDATEINTSIIRGKIVRRSRSKRGAPVDVKRPNFKKAFVRLKEGQSLPTPELASPEGQV
jgi:large subunit ribosomal protein L23